MSILSIDLETYSDFDITKTGVYRYCEAPNFTILLFAYAFDEEEIEVIDLELGELIPKKVIDALFNKYIVKSAFNANFERTALAKYLEITMPPEQWRCTMVKSMTMGLPRSLAMVSKALNFKEDDQKMKAGKALIQYFCKPCKPTKTNGGRTRNFPEHDPQKWNLFKLYCKQDVQVEREIRNRLKQYSTTAAELRLWDLDQRVNDRGINTDLVLISRAIKCNDLFTLKLVKEAKEITGLQNPNSAAQLKKWLGEKVGFEVTSLTKESVPLLIEKAKDSSVIRLLELRQLMSKTSIKKYKSMKDSHCQDGRVRGLLQFYGANRTGRWAGRLIQVQNLPQNHLPDLDTARNLIKTGDFDFVEMLYDSIPDTLSQLIRTAFIPTKGNRFIVADFSAIEARVIAWIAGEQWRLDVFATHGKIYEASASKMFKVPIESIVKGSPLRQKGKISELACIAEDQLVLTDKGLVKIQNVTKDMQVWDGIEFVMHDGVIYKGIKEVITYEGLTATKDHLVWVAGQSKPVQFGNAASSGTHILQTGNDRRPIWICENNKLREKMVKDLEPLQNLNTVYKLQKNSMDRFKQPYLWKIKRMSSLFPAKKNSKVVRQAVFSSKAEMYQPKRLELLKLWRTWDRIQVQLCFGGGAVDDRELWIAKARNGAGQNRHKRTLRARESSMGNSSTKLCQSKKVYDLINCGPRNRFTVSGKLVHNCGYGGGVGSLISMGALKMGLDETELPKLITEWRQANQKITKFWWDCDRAAKKAIKEKTTVTLQLGIEFIYEPGFLFILLPSGRKLAYVKPRVVPHETFNGDKITYEGMAQTSKQWVTLDTYGPKLVENIVQAVARDCLREAMFKVEKAGFKIVMHVHDEIILDVPIGESCVEDINKIFGEDIPWAKGLLLKADGYETSYYMKD